MHGSYFFVAEDGERFEAVIGMFVMDASGVAGLAAGNGRVLH